MGNNEVSCVEGTRPVTSQQAAAWQPEAVCCPGTNGVVAQGCRWTARPCEETLRLFGTIQPLLRQVPLGLMRAIYFHSHTKPYSVHET